MKLTLYGRVGCHLCEEMAELLDRVAGEFRVEVRHVDIDQDRLLAERFNDFVPVLMDGDRELSRYRLDYAAVRAYLAEIR